MKMLNVLSRLALAMAVGADLWHMGNVVKNLEFLDEKNRISTFAFQGIM